MTTLNSRLQLALLNRKKGRNLLEKGFTLVELMIVVVIVGVLSAVALPSFLNQTLKAKATEAKSDEAAIVKNTSAEYQQGGAKYIKELATKAAVSNTTYTFDATNTTCDNLGGRLATQTQKFDYYCSLVKAVGTDPYLDAGTYTTDDYVLVVTALGDSNDTALTNKVVTTAVNLDTGHTQLVKTGTCQAFGGSITAAPAAANMAPGTPNTATCA